MLKRVLKKSARTRVLGFGLAFAFLSPTFAAKPARIDFDREISRQKQELDAIRHRLSREQKDLEDLKARQSSTLGTLEKLSGSIALTNTYLRKLETTESWLNGAVRETESDLRGLSGRIRERNQVMAKRVRALYISGGPEENLFVGGGAAGQFFERVFFMRRVLRYDATLVSLSRADAHKKRQVLARLGERRQELVAFREMKAREKQRFAKARAEQQEALSELQNDVSAKDKALRELRENAQLLNEIILGLERRRREELAKNKKARTLETGTRYCLPVQGPIVSRYGRQYHSTLKTTTLNLGIEIQGPVAAPVRAAVSGEVALITRIPGYGQGIILDNGSGYFTIYANLSGIRVNTGDKVKTCQELAQVAPDPGRVYFEVRKGTKTLDPSEWLLSKP